MSTIISYNPQDKGTTREEFFGKLLADGYEESLLDYETVGILSTGRIPLDLPEQLPLFAGFNIFLFEGKTLYQMGVSEKLDIYMELEKDRIWWNPYKKLWFYLFDKQDYLCRGMEETET